MKGAAARIISGALLGATLTAAGSLAAAPAVGRADRLDRFRELALSLDASGGGALPEVYALLDGEIVENLAGGGVFASPAFLEERLEAFAEAWGGLSVRLFPLTEATVAAISFTELAQGSTVRVYGQKPGGPALLVALTGEGWPVVRPLPPGVKGQRQFLVTWEGPLAASGARPLRFDVVREEAPRVRVTWSSAAQFPEGLTARGYLVRGTDIAVRYEARYPGWTPGCDGQAEYEDRYRLPPGASAFLRASRRELNGWHREVHAAAARLFATLSRGDRAPLASVVPDASLRARLPATLRSEAACDGLPARDGTVAISAVAGEHEPWTLTFRREAGRWRLTGAAPMIP